MSMSYCGDCIVSVHVQLLFPQCTMLDHFVGVCMCMDICLQCCLFLMKRCWYNFILFLMNPWKLLTLPLPVLLQRCAAMHTYNGGMGKGTIGMLWTKTQNDVEVIQNPIILEYQQTQQFINYIGSKCQ